MTTNSRLLFIKLAVLAVLVTSFTPAFAQDSAQPPGSNSPPSAALAEGQTLPPPDTASFFQSVQLYFTSFNTNLDSTFGEARGSVSVGIDSISNGKIPLANSINFAYGLFKGLSFDAVIRDGGISGAIISYQGGFGLNFIVHDAKLTVYLDGGYDEAVETIVKPDGKKVEPERVFGEIGMRVQKALTRHTFAGVGMGAQFPSDVRIFSAFAGFTF